MYAMARYAAYAVFATLSNANEVDVSPRPRQTLARSYTIGCLKAGQVNC